MKAQRRGRDIALLICNLTARKEWMVNAMPWPLNPRETTQYPSCRRTGKTREV